MTYVNPFPNFSIVLPGGCNAGCSFCFWKPAATAPRQSQWREGLRNVLARLPDNFQQLSITGGEPTLSSHLDELLQELRGPSKGRFRKVVLTTNGSNLRHFLTRGMGDNLAPFEDIVTHINISRHQAGDLINRKVFRTDSVPSAYELGGLCYDANCLGIPVTFSKVLRPATDYTSCLAYLKFARRWDASSVFFRKQHGDLEPHPAEEYFRQRYKVVESRCPVCMTRSMIVDGMPVSWKYSLAEPADVGQHEVIMQQNGHLTWDWAGLKPYELPGSHKKVSAALPAGRVVRPTINAPPPLSCGFVDYRVCGGGGGSCG